MRKLNCWEFKKCGREPKGSRVSELGICPAATEKKIDGIHGGKNGGRACWVITGTLCNGRLQGNYHQKFETCFRCDFYNKVKREEENFSFVPTILKKLSPNEWS